METGKTYNLKIEEILEDKYKASSEDGDIVYILKEKAKEELAIDDNIEAFIYGEDSNYRYATTYKSLLEIEQFAYLEIKQIGEGDVMADWGLQKTLRIPYYEQNKELRRGEWTFVFLLKDEKTDELVGSTKIEEFIIKEDFDVQIGDKVSIMAYYKSDYGLNVIVNHKYKALIFNSELHSNIQIGDSAEAYIKNINENNKIDISLEPVGYRNNIDDNTAKVLDIIKENSGYLKLNDKSDPEDIKNIIGLSKKAFKKCLGNLYKQRIITIEEDGIRII
ncbi:MAG: GntR family transcriptional regulator [Flavobacteriaceae bacterium]|nr:GntR family transcriptional regulator [Flavobacteriaceae bacterium]